MRIRGTGALLVLLASGCGAATIAKPDGGMGGAAIGGAAGGHANAGAGGAAIGGAAGGHANAGAGGAPASGGAGGAPDSGGAGGAPASGGASGASANGGAGGASASGGAGGCAPETDPQFCTRLGKTCEMFAGTDNCGAARNANCGTCTTGMGCVVNVCQTPVCTTFNYQSMPIAAFSRASQEDVTIAASSSGQSIAYAQSATGTCEMYTIYLADETAPDSGAYTSRDITSWVTTNTLFDGSGEMAALSGDGLTMIVISADQTALKSAKRSALQLIDFGTPSAADYVTINGFLAGTAGKFRAPNISADGLELYYTINGISTAADGIYRAVRASTSVPFPAGARDAALTSDYEYVSGISSDRLAVFLFKGFGGVVFTRASTSADWSNPNAPSTPPQIGDWDHKPFQDCRTLVATGATTGGCANQDIYFLYRQ
jgi:hypothetical protein